MSKRWNTAVNDVSKYESPADTAIRLPNTNIRNSSIVDKTEYFHDAPNYIIRRSFSVLANLQNKHGKKKERLDTTNRGDLGLNLKRLKPNIKNLLFKQQIHPTH
ncbi:hypothetical protein TNCV_30651 [Trichonephila clavipes]|nr:hypothetical protein TNCV_30651 [Trichonephila clavipes]